MAIAGLGSARTIKVLAAAVAALLLGLGVISALAVAPANPAFQRIWDRTDRPVDENEVDRTWMWGPEANTDAFEERYAESPDGERLVQYYDKSRMEITTPGAPQDDNPWYVTNGLLVVEMISGRMQIGHTRFEVREPAGEINVAGDPDDPDSPTYATFAELLAMPPVSDGALITQRLDRDGDVTVDPSLASRGVTAAFQVTVPGIDHQVAAPFWEFMTSSGVVYEDGAFVEDDLFENAFYATGYPISEAYWANIKVAGVDQDVLMQCFERRCLTYTPGNDPGWQVEAGNVGQHYYRWRYPDGGHLTPTPTPSPTPSPEPEPLPEEQLFVAYLNGANVVTPGAGLAAVETDATGTVYFYIRDGGTAIDYQIVAHQIANVTAAHIHDGNATENGPVLVPLFVAQSGTSVNPNGVLVTSTIEADDLPEGMTIAALANLMLDGEVYVNVHTIAYPDGEIRGQTGPLGDAVFHASLDGDNELPPTDSEASGEAVLLYDAEDGIVEFQLALADITGRTAAHIHRGQSNVNGPILVPLDAVTNPSPVGSFTGVISGVFTESELEDVGIDELVYLMLTGNTYINVHTLENPDGEIRGQIETGSGLVAEDDAVWFTTLHGGNENPVVDTEASGYLIIESDAAGALTYTLIVAQIDDATAAHLHLGALGENGDVIATLFTKSATTPGLENGILAEGTITPDMPDYGLVVYALLTGNAYVNVHSTIEPDGEIRGQLTPALGPVFLARLDGAQQIPETPEEPVVTDATGVAVFWGDEDEELLRYAIIINDLENPIAAHLHHARAGRTGPIVATLYSAPASTVGPTDGILERDTLTVDDLEGPLTSFPLSTLFTEMAEGSVYIDIQTLAYLSGEIRGQVELVD